MKIKAKITLAMLCSILMTAGLMIVVLIAQQRNLSNQIRTEIDQLAHNETESIALGVYHMIQAQDQLLQQKVNADLSLARDILQRAGGASIDPERTVEWQAVNQFTGTKTPTNLPAMLAGDEVILPTLSFDTPLPVVDHTQRIAGTTTTIFQRMNEQGDMLRVATSVQKLDGQRAVGTFIPATNPDGKPNPVVTAVMAGKTYYGRAYVVNAWYVTAYEPIRDAAGTIVGMLYTGVKQESVASLRQAILDTVVGNTGYVFVLGGSGDHRGHYLVSQQGKRDGEDAWHLKDADGITHIQAMVNQAKEAPTGTIVHIRYRSEESNNDVPRYRTAACVYYEPWDWVIAAATFDDEFYAPIERTAAAAKNMIVGVIAVAGLACAISMLTIMWIAGRITNPINGINKTLHELAEGEADLTHRVKVATRDELADLADGFNKFVDNLHDLITDVSQSATLVARESDSINRATSLVNRETTEQSFQATQIAAAMEEMSSSVTDVSKQSSAAAQQAKSSGDEAIRGSEIVTRTVDGMRSIAEVVRVSAAAVHQLGERSQEIGQVIDVINDIAEQTNLLALNAAIEAARAGEHGRGFAVVADEVRKLADRTTQATKEIADRIQEIQAETQSVVNQMGVGTSRVEEGVELAGQAGQAIAAIRDSADSVFTAIESIAAVGQQQATASMQIANSVDSLNDSARKAAESAEQVSIAVANLTTQAQSLRNLVGRFKLQSQATARLQA